MLRLSDLALELPRVDVTLRGRVVSAAPLSMRDATALLTHALPGSGGGSGGGGGGVGGGGGGDGVGGLEAAVAAVLRTKHVLLEVAAAVDYRPARGGAELRFDAAGMPRAIAAWAAASIEDLYGVLTDDEVYAAYAALRAASSPVARVRAAEKN